MANFQVHKGAVCAFFMDRIMQKDSSPAFKYSSKSKSFFCLGQRFDNVALYEIEHYQEQAIRNHSPINKPVNTLKGKAVNTPKGKAANTPKGKAVNTPKGKAANTPKGKAANTPKGKAANTPKGKAVNTSKGRTVNTLKGKAVKN